MDKTLKSFRPVWPLLAAGAVAIVVGGMVAAFSAANPSRIALWASAYLVLVIGVVQILIGVGMAFVHEKLIARQVWTIFALLNIGSLSILIGTVMKTQMTNSFSVVIAGSIVYVAAMVLGLLGLRGSHSSWWRFDYVALLIAGIVSAGIGAVLSSLGR
ncbi:MAG: hypothetical protein ABI397_02695 [Candidatus Saccharimonas sp.]